MHITNMLRSVIDKMGPIVSYLEIWSRSDLVSLLSAVTDVAGRRNGFRGHLSATTDSSRLCLTTTLEFMSGWPGAVLPPPRGPRKRVPSVRSPYGLSQNSLCFGIDPLTE